MFLVKICIYIYILKYSHNLNYCTTWNSLRNVSSFRTTLILFVIEAR